MHTEFTAQDFVHLKQVDDQIRYAWNEALSHSYSHVLHAIENNVRYITTAH